MMLGSWIRRTGFWTCDALKGGITKKHYRDIIVKMTKNFNDGGRQLATLLEHAKRSTPYYKNISAQVIKDFPVLTKGDYKANFDAFQSDLYQDMPLHRMSTSGSTGTPFIVNQDMNKRKRTLADIIYFNDICKQKLGDKYIYFRVWTDKNKKSKWIQFQQNLLPFNILQLNDGNLEQIRQLLKRDKSIKSVLGFPSTYEHLVNYLEVCGDNPDMFNIKVIISGAEVLDMRTKQRIKETLGCTIIDRYSNQENGMVAQTIEDMSDEFIVNTASYYVELLKLDSDEDADYGELSRIVVTDLYNFAMPIIRSDTGDLAIKCGTEQGGVKKFRSIQGRRVDTIYDTKGNKLSAFTWSTYMCKFDKLKQFQFIQEDAKKYVLKVNGARGIYTDEELDKTLRDVVGADGEIDIQFVDKIPVLASGKFKPTVCNYHP